MSSTHGKSDLLFFIQIHSNIGCTYVLEHFLPGDR